MGVAIVIRYLDRVIVMLFFLQKMTLMKSRKFGLIIVDLQLQRLASSLQIIGRIYCNQISLIIERISAGGEC